MRRRNKMGAVKVGAMVGDQACRFDSKAEYRYALWLEGEKQAGRVDQWVHHPGRDALLGVAGEPVAWIEPDFSVMRAGGLHEYHEIKGMATAAWRIKRALLEQQEPDIRYVVIDAGWPDEKNGGPRLFDDRRKNKSAARKARAAKALHTGRRK